MFGVCRQSAMYGSKWSCRLAPTRTQITSWGERLSNIASTHAAKRVHRTLRGLLKQGNAKQLQGANEKIDRTENKAMKNICWSLHGSAGPAKSSTRTLACGTSVPLQRSVHTASTAPAVSRHAASTARLRARSRPRVKARGPDTGAASARKQTTCIGNSRRLGTRRKALRAAAGVTW